MVSEQSKMYIQPNSSKRVWYKSELRSLSKMRDMIYEYNADGFIFVKYLDTDECDRAINHIIESLYQSQVWSRETLNLLVPPQTFQETIRSRKHALYELMKSSKLNVFTRRNIVSVSPLSLRSRASVPFFTEAPAYHLSDAWKLRQSPLLYQFAHSLLNFKLTDDNHSEPNDDKNNDHDFEKSVKTSKNIFCGIDPCHINYGWKSSRDVNEFLFFSLNPFHHFNYENDPDGHTSFNQVLMKVYYSPNSTFTCVPGSHTRSYFENEFYGKFPSFQHQQSLYDQYNKTGMYVCRPGLMGKALHHEMMSQKQIFKVEPGVIVIYSPYLLITKNMCSQVSSLSKTAQIYYGQNLSYFTDNTPSSFILSDQDNDSHDYLGRLNYETISKPSINEFKDRFEVFETGRAPILTSCMWPIQHVKLYCHPTVVNYAQLIKRSVDSYQKYRPRNQWSPKLSDFVKTGPDGKYLICEKYPFWKYEKPKLTKLGKRLVGIKPWSNPHQSLLDEFNIDGFIEIINKYDKDHNNIINNETVDDNNINNDYDINDPSLNLDLPPAPPPLGISNEFNQIKSNIDTFSNYGNRNIYDISYFFPEFVETKNDDQNSNNKRKREDEEEGSDNNSIDEKDNESINNQFNELFYTKSYTATDKSLTLFDQIEFNNFDDYDHNSTNIDSCDNTLNDFHIHKINSLLDKPERSLYCYEQLDLPPYIYNNNTLISSFN